MSNEKPQMEIWQNFFPMLLSDYRQSHFYIWKYLNLRVFQKIKKLTPVRLEPSTLRSLVSWHKNQLVLLANDFCNALLLSTILLLFSRIYFMQSPPRCASASVLCLHVSHSWSRIWCSATKTHEIEEILILGRRVTVIQPKSYYPNESFFCI